MKKIIYWSPHINPQIATVKAVLNSAKCLSNYDKNFQVNIINVFGEWNKFKHICSKDNINLVNLTNFNFNLPINGFIKSRLFYILISIISIFKLPLIINKLKPDYFIAHLIVIPVLFISMFYSKTKFILRISGLPKLHFLRKNIWRVLSKNLHLVTCPTMGTLEQLIKLKIFQKNKVLLLEDPILDVREIMKKRLENIPFESGYILSVGRLTYQKNFEFLIENFSKIQKEIKKKLIIIGSGELKKKLEKLILINNAEKFIRIIDYQDNIHKFYKNADCFILTSRWEDPGFVLIEAAVNNVAILSCDSPNGPKDFIKDEANGYAYTNDNKNEFRLKLVKLLKNLQTQEVYKKKVSAKLFIKKYTIFSHYLKLKQILK